MASIKFFIRGNKKTATIYVRFSANRKINYKKPMPLTIATEYWNNKTGKVRNIATYKGREKMQAELNTFAAFLLNQYNTDIKAGYINGVYWLQKCIDIYFNKPTELNENFLSAYAAEYLQYLSHKRNEKTSRIGATPATIAKYKTIIKKIVAFDTYTKKVHLITDVGVDYRNKFLDYLTKVEQLTPNTAGRYVRFVKTICVHAQNNGLPVHAQLIQVKGFAVQVDKVYLTLSEIAILEKTKFETPELTAARDWLVLGCYIGQRVSDLLGLNTDNLTQIGNLDFVELEQKKTRKRVTILLHDKAKKVLQRNGGGFPLTIATNLASAATIFNKRIKTVCKIAGLVALTNGAKINPTTRRKEKGTFPKWQLITSHICRRSFATNYYGDIPTALLMNVTGHSTEKEFLNYIGKTSVDYAQQMAKYWNIQSQKENIKKGDQPPLKIAQ